MRAFNAHWPGRKSIELTHQIHGHHGHLTGTRLADGTRVALDTLIVAPKFVANADLLAPFGLAPVEVSFGGQVTAARIAADPGGATSVPGIYVAGNVTDPQAQVITSAAAGLTASAAINMDLVAEDARRSPWPADGDDITLHNAVLRAGRGC